MKICTRCGIEKSLSDFHKNKNRKDGHVGICKPCAILLTKNWQDGNKEKLQQYQADRSYTRHGISKKYYLELLAEQNYSCIICLGNNGKDRLVIDHDHTCCPGDYSCGSCIRGLLCSACNRALGLLKEDTNALLNAIRYLNKRA